MDHSKVMEFLGQVVTDLGAAGAAGLTAIGSRLGLYSALAQGPATPEQLAERTGCHPRYLTEWLRGQAAGGYISYDSGSGQFFLTDEQQFCLADPNGPNLPAASLIILGYLRAEPQIAEAFRSGEGFGCTNTTRTSSSGATRSTAPATSPSSCPTGFLPSMGSRRS